jgi:hypothetical protein
MPTGYTAGIIDGEITTFEEFATRCTRAFGATIHMRDDSLDSPYEPRTPSEYYVNSLQSQREELEKMESLTDEEIVQEFETSAKENLDYHEKALEKRKVNLEKLNSILSSAKAWVPPTEEHEGLRTFMIEQIESTIKMDGDPSYHVNNIVQIKQEMDGGIDTKIYREKRIKEIKDRILYFEAEHQKELVRCKQSNDWMEKFFGSIQTK